MFVLVADDAALPLSGADEPPPQEASDSAAASSVMVMERRIKKSLPRWHAPGPGLFGAVDAVDADAADARDAVGAGAPARAASIVARESGAAGA